MPNVHDQSGRQLLTIVVPAYNVEHYIGACLEPLFSQCAKHGARIVIVVDGATDGTRNAIDVAIADAAFRDVLVIEQENQGLSSARNRGLAEVRTEYVGFIDSDDFPLERFLDEVVPLLIQHRPDIIEFNAEKVDEDGQSLGVLQVTPIVDGSTRPVTIDEFLGCFRCYAWARVVRTTIALSHPFPPGRRFEDAATVPWYYHGTRNILGIGKPLLAYRQRAGSILASPAPKDVLDLAYAVNRAALEYSASRDPFWQVVANRLHQVACGRIPLLPQSDWSTCFEALKNAISGVPPTSGLLRSLQIRWTPLYVGLLFGRRLMRAKVASTEPRLLGRNPT